MTTTYFTITSVIDKQVKTEDFLLGDDVLDVMDELDKVAIRNFGADHFPLENGEIGFYNSAGDYVYLEEKDLLSQEA